MRILLAGIPEILDQPLRQSLSSNHVLMSPSGDIRDLATCHAVADCDLVIHGIPDSESDLDRLDHASRGTWNVLTTTGAKRYILLSTMRLFDAYGEGWHVTESWSPRPTTDVAQLAPYLAEVASREISRTRPIECFALRLDNVVTAEVFHGGEVDPIWLTVDDAINAIIRGTEIESLSTDGSRWVPLHIVRGDQSSRFPIGQAGTAPFDLSVRHRVTNEPPPAPASVPVPPRSPGPIRDLPAPTNVVMFGSGGPLGAITATELIGKYRLRLTDYRSLADIAASPPQSEGAPLPTPVIAPDEERLVDVTDPIAVRDAVRGMDAVVNCTVMRHDPIQAFRVNTLGAFNVMRAVVDEGIRRVVHTGPVLTLAPHPAGYSDDRDVASNAPPRPGDNLYFVSKLLGQEICRIFAEEHDIACPTLLFCGFIDPGSSERNHETPGAFSISWRDSATAMEAALRVEHLPVPFQVFHILTDAPHDRYTNLEAKQLLGWEPVDRLDHLWRRKY